MLENLESVRNQGIRKFIKTERLRWTCPKCGGIICVHRGFCITCGEQKNNPVIFKKGITLVHNISDSR
jgi:uncharacterized OB-fold protein